MIRIDFEDTYALRYEENDSMHATFVTHLMNGESACMKISFEPFDLDIGCKVFNMIFGPVNAKGFIDVYAKLKHANIGKLFSTILRCAMHFLRQRPAVAVGIDGSTDARTYLYHRIFLSNDAYLEDHIHALGVDWFAKQLRTGVLDKLENGDINFRPKVEKIRSNKQPVDLYGYYLLTPRDSIFKHL